MTDSVVRPTSVRTVVVLVHLLEIGFEESEEGYLIVYLLRFRVTSVCKRFEEITELSSNRSGIGVYNG